MDTACIENQKRLQELQNTPPMSFSMQRQQLYENADRVTLWNDDDSIITECLCNPTTGMWWYKTFYVDEDCWREARPRWVPQRDILCCNPTAKQMTDSEVQKVIQIRHKEHVARQKVMAEVVTYGCAPPIKKKRHGRHQVRSVLFVAASEHRHWSCGGRRRGNRDASTPQHRAWNTDDRCAVRSRCVMWTLRHNLRLKPQDSTLAKQECTSARL
jgi:hypothetical protein